MGRFNCLSRKAQPDPADQPVAARPVCAFRPKQSKSKSNLQVTINIRQAPLQQLPHQPLPNAMNNAIPRGGTGGNVQPAIRKYIEISDDEDDDVALSVPALPRQQVPAAAEANGPPQPALPRPQRQVEDDANLAPFLIEDGDEFDVNDPELAQLMMEGFERERDEQAAVRQPSIQPDLPAEGFPLEQETRIECIDQVVAVFPGICRDYVSELYETRAQSSDFLISHIFEDKVEKGIPYPKAKETQKSLKRKRELDEDEEAARKYGSTDRVVPEGAAGLRPFIRTLLSKDFPETPLNFIDSALQQCGHRLFSTYLVLEEAHRTWDVRQPTYNKIKNQSKARRMGDEHTDPNLETTIARMSQSGYQSQDAEVLRELQAARRIKKRAEAKLLAERLAEIEEEKNLRKAEAEGTMSECGCCFGDFPLNRMVHCDSVETLHFFCRTCAKSNADTEIGNSKYILTCMSMDGCDAGFSLEQRNQFLDEKTIIALERNEQEANLRLAGIENLASCPFCPYAAEYPPVEIDREFRCQAEDCEKVSCRLCKLESHIPKSCEEHAKDNGLSIRRQIEEAMSAALIRKCNKCETPFVKEEGCNKMTCTRNGCRNIQCYVCSKSCDYNHFDDARRGGQAGNCPLFESVEDRHDSEVKKAEREALDKVRAEHPEYSEEDLKIQMSENVKKDDERRKANDPRMAHFLQVRGGMPVRFAPVPNEFRPAPVAYPQFQPTANGGVEHGPVPPQPQRFMPRFPEGFLEHYDGPLDGEIFAGLWDDVPGLLNGGPPPRRPQVYPYFHQAAAQGAPNQPVQAAAQYFAGPAFPLNPYEGHLMVPGNVQGMQALAPGRLRNANAGDLAQPMPPLIVGRPIPPNPPPQLQAQQLRPNLANMQQLQDNRQAQQQQRAMEAAIAERVRNLNNHRMDGLGAGVAIQPGDARIQGAAAARIGRFMGRGFGGPLNPPNGQA